VHFPVDIKHPQHALHGVQGEKTVLFDAEAVQFDDSILGQTGDKETWKMAEEKAQTRASGAGT
jgi:hypothetical protein